MKIGIISDTHGILPPGVFPVFSGVGAIFHAGDIGSEDIIPSLEQIAPVYAVIGNIDSWPIIRRYPRTIHQTLLSIRIHMIHDILNIRYYSYELFRRKMEARVVIYGHTHIPGHELYQNTLFINPGSVSRPKTGGKGTVAILDLTAKQLQPDYIEIKPE